MAIQQQQYLSGAKKAKATSSQEKQSTVSKSCLCRTCPHVQKEQSTWKNSREQRRQLPDVTPGNNQNSNLHVHWPWSRCICATSGTIHRTWCKKQKLKKIKQLYQPTTRVEGSNQCKPLQPVEMEKNNQLPDKKQNHCSCMLHTVLKGRRKQQNLLVFNPHPLPPLQQQNNQLVRTTKPKQKQQSTNWPCRQTKEMKRTTNHCNGAASNNNNNQPARNYIQEKNKSNNQLMPKEQLPFSTCPK